jgi:hypothetical protein
MTRLKRISLTLERFMARLVATDMAHAQGCIVNAARRKKIKKKARWFERASNYFLGGE